MLSARVATNAMPRRIHIVPSVMMNGCTRSPTTSAPFSNPHTRPTPTHATSPTIVVAAGLIGPSARRSSAIDTPESAYIEPTERSMPPEMMTTVAPIAMMAKKLASVAV